MFPMEFDYHILSSLPTPSEQGVKRVQEVLKTLVIQKIVPHFRNRRGTDLIQLARVRQGFEIQRFEDDGRRIRSVSLLTRTGRGWDIRVHERVYDYMAFIIPAKPEFALRNSTTEEHKVLAFAEFFLRHEVEHMLYPERKEHEIIRSDVDFAMEWRKEDPTSYRMLCSLLKDNLNGIKGEEYLELLEHAEEGKSIDCVVNRIINSYVTTLGDLPVRFLEEIFPSLDPGIKTRVIGECYRKSRSTSFSLVQRSSSFQKIFRLFALLTRRDQEEAFQVFSSFKDRWGLEVLFHELDLPEVSVEEKDLNEIFDLLRERVENLSDEQEQTVSSSPSLPPPTAPVGMYRDQAPPKPVSTPGQPAKSIKDRIEEARNDPYFPQQVMELIDKNKMNAAGQSGAKYTELIEVLLAIPWARIRKIWVSPAEFEAGLNRSHYGLEKPKELICDFFANLIWRYHHFKDEERRSWRRTGSALLFVGPPGVGKTSLAISIARNLGIPYHKISLGGLRDEADIRGYGFTYEGSKPGPIVQGLVKMGAMNGMFILDEADKTEKFAIATLLEILDPEQNHLFHDKYTQSTVDIDLSNCHFVLTANTLETVPPAVLDRCEVIFLDRYSIEEKIAIARKHLIQRVRGKYMITENEIFFDSSEENELLRLLIRNYTFEAGVRDLERILRTLFLRIHRKEILAKGQSSVRVSRAKIRDYLDAPVRPRHINEDDRVGEMMALGVNMEMGMGSLIPIQVTRVKMNRESGGAFPGYMSVAHATGNIEKIMDESRKVAATAIFHCAGELGIDVKRIEDPVHLHFMGAATKKDGPSAGSAIALALASLFLNRPIRRDVAMTGEIDTQGRITGIGGLGVKLETAYAAGCRTMIIPKENLYGMDGIERLPDALKQELQILTYNEWKRHHEPFDYKRHVLQVVAVDHIIQAIDVAIMDREELTVLDDAFVSHANRALTELNRRQVKPLRCLRIINVTDPDQLDPGFYEPGFCEMGYGSILLVNPEIRETIRKTVPGLHERVEIRDFDPELDSLSDVVQQAMASQPADVSAPLRISVIAPPALLEKDGIRVEDFPPDASFEGLRLFGNTCTIENMEIKECRLPLNQVHHHLTRLEPEMLEESPFLVQKDGIYMMTLSFIPEKYRLDTKRSEEILLQCLTRWLEVMEGRPQEESDETLSGAREKVSVEPHARY